MLHSTPMSGVEHIHGHYTNDSKGDYKGFQFHHKSHSHTKKMQIPLLLTVIQQTLQYQESAIFDQILSSFDKVESRHQQYQ